MNRLPKRSLNRSHRAKSARVVFAVQHERTGRQDNDGAGDQRAHVETVHGLQGFRQRFPVRRFGGPTEPDGQDVHRAEPGGDSGDMQKKSDFGCHEVETSHNMNSGRRVPDLRNQHFVGGDIGTAFFRPAAAVGLPEVFALRPVDEILFGFEDGFRHQVGAVLRFQQAERDEARNGLHRLGGILERSSVPGDVLRF